MPAMNAFIESIRVALPEAVLDNDQLAREFPSWTAEKIYASTGIRERRVSAADECASDLAVKAASQLLEEEDRDPRDIDFVLNCTQTPDYVLPTTACLLQDRLGLPRTCGALDYNLGCSGYVYGLGLAKALIASGQARDVLLITADTHTKLINPRDKSVRMLLGDAATATLIRADARDTLMGPFVYGTDGSGADNLIVPAGGMRRRYVQDADLVHDASGNARTDNDIWLNGAEIFNFTLRVIPDTVAAVLQRANLSASDIDLFVFHQANRFILEHLRKKLAVPVEKFVYALEHVGNTASSSIPIALQQARDAGRLEAGSLVMLVGFGVGYSWAATVINWME
jgi:3-oxoacyl-[acyl-carrier-protein] synthase III